MTAHPLRAAVLACTALLLGEAMTATLMLSGAAILGGIALVLTIRHRG